MARVLPLEIQTRFMQIRDRIKELRRVPARQLRPNPKNWRAHPAAQQDALRGVLAEIGYAGALLARELDDGSLELIDGHLRAETTPDFLVPVLIVDLTAAEADKLLATFDPLSQMATIDPVKLESLLSEIHFDNSAVQALLDQVAAAGSDLTHDENSKPVGPEINLPALFQIVVECGNEDEQRELHNRLVGEGYKCRVLTL
jgi:hypothetical protein